MPLIEGTWSQLCNEHSWHIFERKTFKCCVTLLVLLWQVYRLDSRFALTSLVLMTGLDFDLILLTWDSLWQVLKQPVLARLDLTKLDLRIAFMGLQIWPGLRLEMCFDKTRDSRLDSDLPWRDWRLVLMWLKTFFDMTCDLLCACPNSLEKSFWFSLKRILKVSDQTECSFCSETFSSCSLWAVSVLRASGYLGLYDIVSTSIWTRNSSVEANKCGTWDFG